MTVIGTFLLVILLGALAALVVSYGKNIPWTRIILWAVIGTVFLLWATDDRNGCYCHTCVLFRQLTAIPGFIAYLLATWLMWRQTRAKK